MKGPERHFYIPKHERQGLYFLMIILLLMIVGMITANNIGNADIKKLVVTINVSSEANEAIRENTIPKYNKSLFTFDPNTTPDDSLRLLDISDQVINNIIKYRSKGGSFKDIKDLSKIYGIEPEMKKLTPFVKFNADEEQQVDSYHDITHSVVTKNSGRSRVVNQSNTTLIEIANEKSVEDEKVESIDVDKSSSEAIYLRDTTIFFEKETEEESPLIEINGASIYELMLVKGIGEFYANKIVEYRDKMGGYYHIDQLKNVISRKESFDKIAPFLKIDKSLIRKRNANLVSKDSLAFIPQVGYRKAEIALRYKANHYPLKSMEDFRKMKIFSEEDIAIMSLYLSF